MTDEPRTMRELYADHGYDPASLTHPRNVDASQLSDESIVIAYTTVRNPDPDAPATIYDLEEFEIDGVYPTDEVEDATDGAVSYPDETCVTHGVIWSYVRGHLPNVESIGYGDEMYGPDSDFADPHDWERLETNVRANSDSFIRFRV